MLVVHRCGIGALPAVSAGGGSGAAGVECDAGAGLPVRRRGHRRRVGRRGAGALRPAAPRPCLQNAPAARARNNLALPPSQKYAKLPTAVWASVRKALSSGGWLGGRRMAGCSPSPFDCVKIELHSLCRGLRSQTMRRVRRAAQPARQQARGGEWADMRARPLAGVRREDLFTDAAAGLLLWKVLPSPPPPAHSEHKPTAGAITFKQGMRTAWHALQLQPVSPELRSCKEKSKGQSP